MKYCGRLSSQTSLADFDEISVIYDKQDRKIIDYLSHHTFQRTNFIVKDYEEFYDTQEWEKINTIHEQYPDFNFAICFGEVKRFELFDSKLQECIKNTKVPCFTGYLIINFDQLHYVCNQGVSELYIGEDICFDLGRAKAVASVYDVKLRTFPNVAQCSVKQSPPLYKFFIRPEDVEEYSDCIDTLEFWGPVDRHSILLKIYKKGFWYGDLNELILDLNMSIDSRTLLPIFGHMRKTCERKCMKGGQCSACDRMTNIGEKLKENNLIINYKKKH